MVNAPIIVSLTPTPPSLSGEETLPETTTAASSSSAENTPSPATTSSTSNGLNYHNCQQQPPQEVACGKSTSEQGTQTDNDDEEDIDDGEGEADAEDDEYEVNDYNDNEVHHDDNDVDYADDGGDVDENGDVEGGVTDTQRTANGFHDCDYIVNEVVDVAEREEVGDEGYECRVKEDTNEDEAVNLSDVAKICDSSEFCYSIENHSDNVVKSELNNNNSNDESSDEEDDNESVKSVVDVVKNNSLIKVLEPSTPPTIIVPATTSTNSVKMTSNNYTPFTPHTNINNINTQPPHYTVAHTQPQPQPLILGFAPVQPTRLHHHCPQHNPLPPNTQLQFISLQPQPGVPVSTHQPQNQTTSVAAVQSSTAGSWPFIETPLFQIDANGEPRPFCPAHPHGPTGPHDQRFVLHLDAVPTIQISPAPATGIPQQPPQQPPPQQHGGGKRKHHGYRG
ncbi:hypothetical protein ACFFRR_004760, partial [Megaselia abdita]